ncbi:HlyD family type I secretion periplasmic adaptor subunit [Pseudocolwellia agarivorans]|uniref:HlyD family type I secretion periplasmic adaptor subunit n=1 Tax=Pseudocolwellia agarivorans TaxID=1911682 RepID=UPI000984E758|nr:HlyD family type I secretion periplasmic adaptor subunit [Pseudocolwellia agarivorans]
MKKILQKLNVFKKTPTKKEMSESGVILDFMPAAIEVLERPVSPIGRFLGKSIIVFCVFTLIWSYFGHLDVVAVAQGKIIPSGRVKQIQPLQKGVVKHIFVTEGQLVQQGEPLIELEKSLTGADLNRISKDLNIAQLNLYRQLTLREKLTNDNTLVQQQSFDWQTSLTPAALNYQQAWIAQQWSAYQARLSVLKQQLTTQRAELNMNKADIEKYKAVLPIIQKRVDSLKSLRVDSYVSESSYLELEQQLIEYQQEMKIAQDRGLMLASVAKETEQQLEQLTAQFMGENLTEIESFQQQVFGLEQELEKAHVFNDKQLLTAPVTGYVQQLSVHTIGGIVTDAQPLMLIVPKGNFLEAEVELTNKDIGFVSVGQTAEIKVETFDFTLYGFLHAEVVDITADAIEDEQRGLVYKMRLKLNENKLLVEGKWIDLIPGMSITAEVKTSRRRIIDYFLSPIQRATDNSLGER